MTQESESPDAEGERRRGFSRRVFIAGAGTLGAGVALGVGADRAVSSSPRPATGNDIVIPFYGAHQAGIDTSAQDRLVFGALNVVEGTTRNDLRDLLRTWTPAAERMTRGEPVGELSEPNAPPIDTGEAIGSPVSRLTVTLGYGPSLFDERFGLAGKRPQALANLPPLPNENLDPLYTGGDICIQACSDDPLVAYHAVRNLARLGMGVVEHNWLELGFGRTSTTTTSESTPRNLMGFKDGTRNIKAEDAELMNRYVWVGSETDQPWLRGGSYLVARRIRMFIENWDRDYLADQEAIFGRFKESGAPLTGGDEFTTPRFEQKRDGGPVIATDAHIRLASHEQNGGLRILRRGYSFTDGIDPERGTLLGGLFFIAFMKSPSQFISLQQKLGSTDALNEYIQHTGSGLFACPPGLSSGERFGDRLFA